MMGKFSSGGGEVGGPIQLNCEAPLPPLSAA